MNEEEAMPPQELRKFIDELVAVIAWNQPRVTKQYIADMLAVTSGKPLPIITKDEEVR